MGERKKLYALMLLKYFFLLFEQGARIFNLHLEPAHYVANSAYTWTGADEYLRNSNSADEYWITFIWITGLDISMCQSAAVMCWADSFSSHQLSVGECVHFSPSPHSGTAHYHLKLALVEVSAVWKSVDTTNQGFAHCPKELVSNSYQNSTV